MANILRISGGGTAVNSCPFPVGFGGFFQTDPNEIYSGTKWEQKKDVFILAAGETYPAGSTGGEAEHMLTVSEMPAHGHNFDNYFNGYPKGDYIIELDTYLTPLINAKNPDDTAGSGVWTNPTGGSHPHNNMPPYYSMPFWIRTA